MTKTSRLSWIVVAILATLTGLYPSIYFLIDRKFGLLSSKSPELLADPFWNIGFYTHILLGGFALFIGWIQFSKGIRDKNPGLHRTIGKLYVIAVLLSSVAGGGISFFATGGWVPAFGFFCLAVVWFVTTLLAFLQVKKGNIVQHQQLMIYSYAACFAAVTLRIWLPLLTAAFDNNFLKAYSIVAWLCWVPNILVAFLITRKLQHLPEADERWSPPLT